MAEGIVPYIPIIACTAYGGAKEIDNSYFNKEQRIFLIKIEELDK